MLCAVRATSSQANNEGCRCTTIRNLRSSSSLTHNQFLFVNADKWAQHLCKFMHIQHASTSCNISCIRKSSYVRQLGLRTLYTDQYTGAHDVRGRTSPFIATKVVH